MTTLVAQLAPQRSTQYTALARDLAKPELLLSPLGRTMTGLAWRRLGGQDYLQFALPAHPSPALLHELGMLSMTSAFFICHEQIGELAGPFLQPLETTFQPRFSPDLAMTRRYRGKTNELFTHFLCNLTRYSSAFAGQPWSQLCILDPLAGGGTTLLVGLVLGAHVAGIELDRQDVKSTADFLRQYMREERIACQVKEERLKKLGHRWRFTLGADPPQTCLLVHGDSTQAQALLPGYRPHLIVADLPYGIQHRGALAALLTQALPGWASMLQPGGAIGLAWDATRTSRAEMIGLVERASPLRVLNEPPYTSLAHQVDRVIKQRDVLFALSG